MVTSQTTDIVYTRNLNIKIVAKIFQVLLHHKRVLLEGGRFGYQCNFFHTAAKDHPGHFFEVRLLVLKGEVPSFTLVSEFDVGEMRMQPRKAGTGDLVDLQR